MCVILLIEFFRWCLTTIGTSKICNHFSWYPTVFCIPSMRTIVPRQGYFKRREEVIDSIGYDNTIVR